MENRALLSALALCFLAAGCNSQKAAEPAQSKPTAAVVPLPAAAPTAPPASSQQDAKSGAPAPSPTQQVAQGGGPKVTAAPLCDHAAHCDVEVRVTDSGGGCVIAKDPDRLKVMKGHAETIKWSMASGSTWALDKIVFVKPNSPFTCRTNGPNINCQTPNTENQATEYPYYVHVKKGTQKCSTDPMIVNGADTTTP